MRTLLIDLHVRILQLSPAEASAEASSRADGSSSDSEDVVDPTLGASDQAEDQPQTTGSGDTCSSDRESSEQNQNDDDEPEQVGDPRLSLKYVALQVSLLPVSSDSFSLPVPV